MNFIEILVQECLVQANIGYLDGTEFYLDFFIKLFLHVIEHQ